MAGCRHGAAAAKTLEPPFSITVCIVDCRDVRSRASGDLTEARLVALLDVRIDSEEVRQMGLSGQ